MSGAVSARRGSALLVVIGMLSFMVISGIAFAVFMRSTRLPASFSRRAVTTRQLAKAALAEAMDRIDRSIANDPHPNVRVNNADKSSNCWVGRVLVSADETGTVRRKPADVARAIVENPDGGCADTVPVLTLEALAYLPPSLVNEARYYGQKTPTAAWQTFDFDSGRYAYIALDVSDYFDVNRVLVEEARSSNPASRVSLAHLFENEAHDRPPSGVDSWEESFMGNYRTPQADGTFSFDKNIPLVSLADFNLAFGTREIGGMKSPFVQYVKSGGAGDGFYGASPGSATFEKVAQMTFVTDSLDAHEDHEDNGTDSFDLDTDKGQPYPKDFFKKALTARSASSILDDCLSYPAWKYLAEQRVSACGMIALADYLDRDDVPTSLALPTTERVPMVCAVRAMPQGLKVVISREREEKTVNEVPEQSRDLEMTVTYRYKLEGEVNVDAWTAFPFRDRAGFKDSFRADCRVAMFPSSREMGFRTSNPQEAGDLLRDPALSANGRKGSVVNLFQSGKACKTNKIENPADAVGQMDGFEFGDASTVFTGDDAKGIVMFHATFVCKQTWDEKGQTWTPTPDVNNYMLKASPTCDFSPLLANGSADSDFATTITGNPQGTSLAALKLPTSPIRFNLALWIAVHNAEGKVVDLVPACMSDDREYNGMDYNDDFTEVFKKLSGAKAPILKFTEPKETAEISVFDKADFMSDVPLLPHEVALAHKEGLVVRDPRYNHAPENWFAAQSAITPQYWLDNAGSADAGCDGDIFMATSDQENLQSIAELAYLPRFTSLASRPSDQDCGDWIKNSERNWTDYPTKGNEAQANMMWRTYNPFDDAENGGGFEQLLEIFHHHGKGLRVNPYSDSTNVIMAAFANTPVSWRVAGYDADDGSLNPAAADGCQADVTDFNGEHAWNAYSPEYEISWADLEGVAGKFMAKVRENAEDVDSWETALLDLFTDFRTDSESALCGIELEKKGRFYSVDKKMLWGFWQNSFAARQQLFLVFFRAEPMMLGGGIAGVTPPQLGAKGVALVWRNPNKTDGSRCGYTDQYASDVDINYKPHQMRVLFYRQFE